MYTKKPLISFLIAVSSGLYIYLFYFTARNESLKLSLIYTGLFAAYLLLLRHKADIEIRWLIGLGLLLRIIPFFAVPALSDDVYRFIWDGRLWAAGINPFAGLPIDLIQDATLQGKGLTQQLFGLLNSPTHYTVYPPVPQYINWLAAKLFSDNIVYSIYFMRTALILAEMAVIYWLIKLLSTQNNKINRAAIYVFNPLVIIEISGNLHHEGLMIAFLFGFLLYNTSHKQWLSAGFLALSVASKLIPLMFLPLILLRQKKWLQFSIFFAVILALLFYPLVDQSFFSGMHDSLSLYYQRFEFNAGLYYLARQIGYWFYGYNTIAIIGKLFLVLSTTFIIVISIRQHVKGAGIPTSLMLIYLVFALFSLILHPWYILLLIALTPLTTFRFPLVWSFFIFFTYLGYSAIGFSENYYIVAIEFIALTVAICLDIRRYARESLNLKEAP